jgi:putative ABC transport system permease protein
MAATGWLLRRGLPRRWVGLVPLALMVALGATASLTALGAADRTAGAYASYLDRAGVGDLLINAGLNTSEVDRVARGLPGVRTARRDAVFLAGIGNAASRTQQEVRASTTQVQVRGSVDGRYEEMDRVALARGRFPTGRREALVSVDLALARGIAVGDAIPISFWSTRENVLAPPDAEVPPLRVERLTVVGVATLPDEVLPDDLYPRHRVIVSPDVAERYDCLPDAPPRTATAQETAAQLAPPACAVAFPYFSLAVDGGPRGVAAALDAFTRRVGELNAEMPTGLTWLTYDDPSYAVIATTTAQERARVDRSTSPTSTGLGVLGAAAGALTVVVFGLAVARAAQGSEPDQRQWWELGLTTGERARVVAVPFLLAAAAGLAVALAAAWLLSPIGPVGAVRSIDPSPGRSLPAWVWLAALALGIVCAAVAGAVVLRSARRAGRAGAQGREVPSVGFVQRLVRGPVGGSVRPEVAEGIRAASRGGGGAGLLTATGTVALAVVLAVVVFGASLTAVVTRPGSYGWPWDVAMMGGAGHGGVDLDAARATLDARDDVAGWTALGVTNAVVDGHPVLSLVAFDEASDVDVTLTSGRLPAGPHQVALAARTASDLGVGVGDEVDVAGEGVEPATATVTAIVVLPALGAYIADRTGPGTGALLPAAALDPELAPAMVSFLGLDLTGGSDARTVEADLRDNFAEWDHNGFSTFDYTEPVRPAEIVNADAMRAVPLLVGVLLGLTGATALTAAVVVSVRARRRDLAVLWALGFTGRQVRNSVRVQAVAAMAGALVVGVPVGIVAGRAAWRTFATQLGVGTDPSIPVPWIVVAVAGALVAALVAAAMPAHVATRSHPATVLRTE